MSRIRTLGLGAWLGAAALLFGGCPDTGDDDGAVCGNGQQEVGESCDDGNLYDGDGCSSSCQKEGFCGNNIVEPGEECDDGNYDPGDGCSPTCGSEDGCGNGRLDVGEECDDDNRVNGDGCSNLCIDEEPGAVCGNGIWEVGEACEPGLPTADNGCTETCEREDTCGDNVLDSGEQCDDGNNISGDGCHFDCRTEFFCGDNTCDTDNAESCEYCPRDCCPDCGNGALETGEQCDDGNNVSGDGCSAGCIDEDGTPTCGNGIWESGEGCDDGNTDPADGCDASCQPEFVCGDDVCDTANHETCVLCAQDCCPECGDGNLDAGEQCDGAVFAGRTCEDFCFTGGSLSCTTTCRIDTSTCTGDLPLCGDGAAGCDEECDDTDLRSQTCETLGFSGGSLGCSGSCTFDVSSCTGRLWYLNEGFEGSSLAFGWRTGGQWEVGVPSAVGPSAAHGGTQCAGTHIDANYGPNAAYAVDTLESPRVDLTSATSPRLRFYRWFDTQPSYDGGNLWISDDGGLSFTLVPATLLSTGYDHDPVHLQPAWSGRFGAAGWMPVVADLSGFAGREIVLRWAFASDGTDSDYPGFYVDDVLIVEAADLPVEITSADPLSTAVTDYPYASNLRAIGGSGTYQWSIVGGTNHAWLSIDPATGVLSGTPTVANLGLATVTLRCEEGSNAANFDERTFQLDVMDAIYFEDFEGAATPTGWVYVASDFLGGAPMWTWGNPSAATEPAACHGGSHCMGTVMGGNYVAPMFAMGADIASTAPIDLAGTTAPTLSYWQWVSVAGVDGGYVTVTTDPTGITEAITPDPAYNGSVGMLQTSPAWVGDLSGQGWHQVTVDLSPWAGQTIRVDYNLEMSLQGSPGGVGWYIDDLVVVD